MNVSGVAAPHLQLGGSVSGGADSAEANFANGLLPGGGGGGDQDGGLATTSGQGSLEPGILVDNHAAHFTGAVAASPSLFAGANHRSPASPVVLHHAISAACTKALRRCSAALTTLEEPPDWICACAAGGDSGLGTAGVLAGSTDNLVGMDLLISPPHTSALPTSSAGDLGTDALPSLPRNFSHTALSGLEHMFDTDVAPHQDHGLFDNLDLGPLGQT